ncbi:MAG: xylulokinase [Armatimonadota bacterium]
MSIYLSFDIGTTSLKTAVISDDGQALAVHVSEYTPKTPQADWLEMSPDAYWNAAVQGTQAVFARSGASPSDLAAIGFSSQGQTFIPIDRSGKPLYDAIVWVDNRAQKIADEWEESWLSPDEYRHISGYPWLPASLTLFKVAWMAKFAPQAHKAWKFLCLPDYLIYRMTGETVTDRVIALMNGFYDLRTSTWAPKLLDAAEIAEEQLPEILEPGSIGGYLSKAAADELGIPAGVPVCVGANDQLAGAIGAGNVRPGIVTETTGTSLALIATTSKLLDDLRFCVGKHAIPNACHVLSFTNTSAIILKWFRDMCADGMDYDSFLVNIDKIPPGCDGLTILPHFAGTGTPTFNSSAKGAILGLTLGHTQDHIARAVMESCACMLQECLEPIADHGINFSSIRSLGGAARSDLWLQMKADFLGIPVERPACSDAASLGAAMMAAAGTGRFSSIEEASNAWYRSVRMFEPNPDLYQTYREVYNRYLEAYQKLYG